MVTAAIDLSLPNPTLTTVASIVMVFGLLTAVYAAFGRGFAINFWFIKDLKIKDLSGVWPRIGWATVSALLWVTFFGVLRLSNSPTDADVAAYAANVTTVLKKADPGQIDAVLTAAGRDRRKLCAFATILIDQMQPQQYTGAVLTIASSQYRARFEAPLWRRALDVLGGESYCFALVHDRLVTAHLDAIKQTHQNVPKGADWPSIRDEAPLNAISDMLAAFSPPPPRGYVYLGKIRPDGSWTAHTFTPYDGRALPRANAHLHTLQPLYVEDFVPDPEALIPKVLGIYGPNTGLRIVDVATTPDKQHIYAEVELDDSRS
jgi:hypothetical protein